jgi:hypothetical protein
VENQEKGVNQMSNMNTKKAGKGKKGRVTLNVSAKLFEELQAFQEHVRVSEGLLLRPTYTEVIGRLWEAYQNSLSPKKGPREFFLREPRRETTNLSDDSRVAI